MAVKPTDYWTFFCNPAIWDVERFLSSNISRNKYLITEWQKKWFHPGQLGVLRVGTDKRKKAQLVGRTKLNPGVYAIVEVLGIPRERGTDEDEFWIDPPKPLSARLVVDIQYVKNMIEQPILLASLKNDPLIEDPYLIKGFQASTMPLMPETFKHILSLIDNLELGV